MNTEEDSVPQSRKRFAVQTRELPRITHTLEPRVFDITKKLVATNSMVVTGRRNMSSTGRGSSDGRPEAEPVPMKRHILIRSMSTPLGQVLYRDGQP